MSLIFVDVEAWGPVPGIGKMTEFGAVEWKTRKTFHGQIYVTQWDPDHPGVVLEPRAQDLVKEPIDVAVAFKEWLEQFPKRWSAVSDNPAYDFPWINYLMNYYLAYNPLGYSARRIGDFAAGLSGNFFAQQDWKKLRITAHDHNPVNDAMGNVEAFDQLLRGKR